MKKLNIGTKVILDDTGQCFTYGGPPWALPYVLTYINRYNPCNIVRSYSGRFSNIQSGYDTTLDLALRTDLKWKIRYIIEHEDTIHRNQRLYIISSNENHMLLSTRFAFRVVRKKKP